MYAVFPRIKLRVNLFALPALLMTLYLEGLPAGGLLLLAALLHEGGHLLAIRKMHLPIRRVDVMPMGALILYDDSLCSLGGSAWIAFAGAGANLAALLICLPWAFCSPFTAFFALANGYLAFLNLLPWEALDGGKLLLSLLLTRHAPEQAARMVKAVSRVTAAGLALLLIVLGVCSRFPLWHLLLSAGLLAMAVR